MEIIMVKKRLLNGEDCPKCKEVSELLEQRGHAQDITQTVVADMADPNSEGMELAKRYQVKRAPFFIVKREGEPEKIYTSVLQMLKEVFEE